MKNICKITLTILGIISGLTLVGLTIALIKGKIEHKDDLLNFVGDDDDEYYYDDVDLSDKE